MKLAGGRVIVDAQSLGQSIDRGSSYRASFQAARRPRFGVFPAPIGLDRAGFLHQFRPLACHRRDQYKGQLILVTGAAVFLSVQFQGCSLRHQSEVPPPQGGSCVRRIVLDPIAGPRQRQGPGGVAGGGVDLRSMIIRRSVRRGDLASVSSGHWLMIFLTRVSARLTRRGWIPLWRTT